MVRTLLALCSGSTDPPANFGKHEQTKPGRGTTSLRAGCLLFLCLGRLSVASEGSLTNSAADLELRPTATALTNVSQFEAMSLQEFSHKVPFQLNGIVTMVDTNRHLVILQDATGAAALDFTPGGIALQPGERISVEGTNSSPYVASFPDYPYRPSGWDIRDSFEAPANWGDYHLQRMRGYLRPPATGEYTFWIASDNSSELWLSVDEDPAKVRKIAFLKPANWVAQHDWSRFPSQRSEPISLRGGQTYYIEALQEQLTQDDNLSVAWQGPGCPQSVIAGQYLKPWVENSDQAPFAQTNGMLREYLDQLLRGQSG